MSHIQIRIDKSEKEAAQKTLKKMGLTLSGGIKLFLLKVVEEQKLPFDISARKKSDTLTIEPEILDKRSKNQEPNPPLEDVPVQTWNPFAKHKIG